jgi:alginate O-acetyltransferase complex protein AlgI
MLFNSYEFLFVFLPLVGAGYFLLAARGARAGIVWLTLASLFFYAWWSVNALPLLVLSALFNYAMSARLHAQSGAEPKRRGRTLAVAIAVNLAVLAYFKYANFFVENLNQLLTWWGEPPAPALRVILPIGISFYTFTQIAYLVDCHGGRVRDRDFASYLLFVTYFPHLIAGPVLHHAQMMPQFADPAIRHFDPARCATGTAIFTVGLAKKLLLADPLGTYADAVFGGVAAGATPGLIASWFGALAYAFQIYFDFSGYSDMAVGLSLLFGIRLPFNFAAPYRATSMVDFWRRWHVSLSDFLRDYLYIPLGGNRLGRLRRYLNLGATMAQGGLWHGASWTFVLWGCLHGAYLTVNHMWRETRPAGTERGAAAGVAGWALTFACVCLAWVLFRADSVATAWQIYRGMFGCEGVSLPAALSPWLTGLPGLRFDGVWHGITPPPGDPPAFLPLLLLFCFAAVLLPRPFAQTAAGRLGQPGPKDRWIGAWWLGPALALLFWLCVLRLGKPSAFLYFQF